MYKVRQVFIFAFSVFLFSLAANAQEIGPSYGFLEVVDFKNEPVPDASVNSLNSGYSEKTNRNGRTEKGIRIHNSLETSFSIEKTEFFTFTDYYGLFDFLRNSWRDNRENPIKIELLKIPETKAERKTNGKQQEMREFFGAARRGDAAAVRKFIKSGLSPNLTTSDLRGIPTTKGVPIIIFAAKSGNGETVREFFTSGVNIRTKNELMSNILVVYLSAYPYKLNYSATESEKKELLNLYENGAESLIEAGADINSGALSLAVSKGYVRTVKKLVAKGANINAEDYNGRTALYTAVESEKKEIIEFLLENGANPNVLAGKDNDYYYYCHSPLTYAVEREDINLIKLLLGKKADPNLTCKNGKNALRSAMIKGKYEIFEMLVEAGANFKAIDENSENNLMYAVRNSDLWMVRKMIEIGVPVNARNKRGSTALMLAVSEGGMNSRLEKVKALLTARADPNIINDKKTVSSYGEFYTCESALINVAANADADTEKDVPLELIDLLISNKADVNFTCENGSNALLRAIRNSQVKGVKKLLEAGADVKGEKRKIALDAAGKVYKSDYNKNRIEEIIRMLEAVVEK